MYIDKEDIMPFIDSKISFRMDKVNIALAMFGMEAVPGKYTGKDKDQ